MGTIKIKLNTWARCSSRNTKFKRGLAAREGYIELCPETKRVFLKEGSHKWKTYDTAISRHKDKSYIEDRKEIYSGLCFETKKDAHDFMARHKEELKQIAESNPIFDHWSVMNVIDRFKPKARIVYGKDIKED